jgi:hypothetical protein
MSRSILPEDITILMVNEIPGEEAAVYCAEANHPDRVCAKCQALEAIDSDLLENVADGLMEMMVEEHGTFRFRLTQAGQARAESLLSTDMDAAQLWIDLENGLK